MTTKSYKFPCGCSFPILEESDDPEVMPLLDFDIEKIPTTCPAVWDLLARGDTKGVFQLESNLGKQWTRKLRPESLEHIGALGALLRPGPLKAVDDEGVSMTSHYCRRKNHEEPVESFHPGLKSILESTYAVLTYQEQSMRIAAELAGFDLVAVDRLRKGIGKKDQKLIASLGEEFLAGCIKVGIIDEATAKTVWDWIKATGRYQFNKCFSTCTVVNRAAGTKYDKNWTGYEVGEMYRIRHSLDYAKKTGHEQLRRKWKRLGNYGKGLSRCADGRIRPNTIVDIQPAGKLPILKIVLSNGHSVRVTANHKFPTPERELTAHDIFVRYLEGKPTELYFRGNYEKGNGKKYGFSHITKEERWQRRQGEDKAVLGQFGNNNFSYTNGSFTEFIKNDALIPRICHDCPKTSGRLELHHINGDRTDSSITNLTRLCASCHKKREYASGRVRKGEKGYPSETVSVISILPDGECETYDVTMASPSHNLVVNGGIVASNSHSISYGIRGYKTAYVKAHFPLAFFTSWLRHADKKQDPQQETLELVNDCRLFGVPVYPPDFRKRHAQIHTDRKAIYFGLANIKGVGEKQVEKLNAIVPLIEAKLHRPASAWSWWDFLIQLTPEISSTVASRLIEAGALDYLSISRQRMLAELDAFSSLTDKEQDFILKNVTEGHDLVAALKALALPRYKKPKKKRDPEPVGPFGGCNDDRRESAVRSTAMLLENPPAPLNDTPQWVSWIEEQLLGISITCSKIDACDISAVNCTCKEFVSGRTGFIMLGVEVQQVREVKTKKGKSAGSKMAFLTLSDGTCSAEDVVCFPEAWKAYGSLLHEGNTVILQGERDDKNKDSKSLIVKKVWQASQLAGSTL